MKQHELRQLIREEISKIINEKEALTPDEQKIVDDILSSINEGMFDDMLEKVKSYARKGLMTVAILASLLSSPNLTQAQKQNIKNAAQTEMTSSPNADKAWENIKSNLSSTKPMLISSKSFDTGLPFQSLNWGTASNKNTGKKGAIAMSHDKNSKTIFLTFFSDTNPEVEKQLVANAEEAGIKFDRNSQGGTAKVPIEQASKIISFVNKSLPSLQGNATQMKKGFATGGFGDAGPMQPGPALNEAFLKMQKLAGIKLNENDEIDYDDENFSDPMIDGYDDDDFIDLNLSFQESPDYHSYDEVLDIIKSYEDKDILEDFKSTFLEDEKVYKENYSDFLNDYIADMSEKEYIKANWISITDPDIYEKAGLV
jgi:hypothetical protein